LFIFRENLPEAYCKTEGFIKLFGLILFNTYQIIIDLALYLNMYNYKLYKKIFYKNSIKL